jgi:hypothetical protein
MSTWGDVLKGVIPAVVGLGTGLITNNQLKQQAKGQAQEAKDIADLQYQTALANQRAIELQNQGGTKPPNKPNTNTALYIGLGVGGVVLIGVVIFAVTRK